MAFDYTGIQGAAGDVLTEYGQTITYTRTADGAYTPGTAPTQTDTTYDMNTVVDNYALREVDGELIQAGDMRAIGQAGGTAPEVGDTATINGDVWRIVNILPINPAGLVLAYEFQLRR
jgi:hypothetical protein